MQEETMQEEKRKSNKHIIIMGVIGIIMSGLGLLMIGNLMAFLMLGVLPMICIVCFMATKNPVFGIAYTVLFFLNRVEIMIVGTLLAQIFILLMIGYFIYVNWLTIKERKLYKQEKELISAE